MGSRWAEIWVNLKTVKTGLKEKSLGAGIGSNLNGVSK